MSAAYMWVLILYSTGIGKCWPEMAVLPAPKKCSIMVKHALQLSVSEEAEEIALGTKPTLHHQWQWLQVVSRMKGHQSPEEKNGNSGAVQSSSKCFQAFQKCFRRLTVSTNTLCFGFYFWFRSCDQPWRNTKDAPSLMLFTDRLARLKK